MSDAEATRNSLSLESVSSTAGTGKDASGTSTTSGRKQGSRTVTASSISHLLPTQTFGNPSQTFGSDARFSSSQMTGLGSFESPMNRLSQLRAMQAQAAQSDISPDCMEDVIEFNSSAYYVEEESGFISIDVVRLGSASGEASVDYSTKDGSARAGVKYEACSGRLEFRAGETRKSIHVKILGDEKFDTTLEFGLQLDAPRGARLGKYLQSCEVMILDDDSFPTNKYKTLLDAGLGSEIPYWPLIYEYLAMHMKEGYMRRAFIATMFCDQLSNLKYVWAILLTNYTVDEVLKPPEGEERPEHVHTTMYIITALSLVPHVVVYILDRAKAYRRIGGRAISQLQQNLLRKFLNYDEASRATVSLSDLQMAITRDVPELVENSFTSVFGILQKLGLLVIFISLQIRKIGTSVMFTSSLFFAFPMLTGMFLSCRTRGTAKRRDEAFKSQTGLVSFIQETTDCYRLINDYMQRPSMILHFAEKVKKCNKANLESNVWGITNTAFAPLLTSIMVGAFALYSYNNVLEGGPLGEFLTGCAIWKGIGDCFQKIFNDVRDLQQAIAPLQNIVFYMNLPIDVPQKMQRSHQMLEDCRKGMEVAEARLAKRKAGHCAFVTKGTSITTGCLTDEIFYATDMLQITARAISFAYPRNVGGGGGVRVLDEASFDIPQGKLVAITGPRGSGKATLLNLIGNVLRLDPACGGKLFVPPYLRVLNVSHDPQTISDLDLFDNLCFSPAGPNDHRPKRVLAICRRLGMSHEIIRLVESHAEVFGSESSETKRAGFVARSLSAVDRMGKTPLGKVQVGTAYSVTKRRGAELMANDGNVLSQTDRCLIHLARAFVTNPDVLILHKPLSQLDDYHVRLVLDLLREFVLLRGVEEETEGRLLRRPRTVIMSVADSRMANVADRVFHVAQGHVSAVDVEELEMLRHYARKLFVAMDLNCDNLVNREEFIQAVHDAPWAAELLGVDRDGDTHETLNGIFDLLDRSNNGEVDFDELVQHLRRKFDVALPRVLSVLHAHDQHAHDHHAHDHHAHDHRTAKLGNQLISSPNTWQSLTDKGNTDPSLSRTEMDPWNIPEVAIEVSMFSGDSSVHDLHNVGTCMIKADKN